MHRMGKFSGSKRRLLVPCVLFFFSLAAGAQETSEVSQAARQLAAQANDRASSLEARQVTLHQLQEAARLFILGGENLEAALTLNRLGRIRLLMNDPDQAIVDHTKALSLLKNSSSAPPKVDNLNGLASAYARLQQLDQARTALRRAINLGRQAGYAAGEAEGLVTSSELENYENHSTALETAQQALRLWKTTNNQAGLARCYAQIGECYLASSMLDQAIENYETALRIWRAESDPVGQAGALISLAFVEYRRGGWEKNLSYLTQAEGLIDEHAEPTKMGQIAGGLAEVFNEVGLPERGLFHFKRALEYFRQMKDPMFEAYAIWAIGCTHYLLHDYPAAIQQLELAIAKGGSDGLLAAQSHEYLGRVYLSMGEPKVALPHLRLALDVYAKTANPKEAAQTYALMGKAYEQENKVAAARQHYQRALKSFAALADRINQSATLYALGRLELQQHNLTVAETHLRESIEVTENVRRVSTSRDLATAFSATVHDRYQSYVECLMRKSEAGRRFDVEAFQISEFARGRALAELLRATQTNIFPGIDPQLSERERGLRQSLRAKEDYRVTLLANSHRKEELDVLQNELAELDAQYKQVLETIHMRYPTQEQISGATAWSLQQIQAEVILDDQTVLLEYSLGREKSYLWAVTKRSLASYELPSEERIRTASTSVYELLKDRPQAANSDKLNTVVQELAQMILSPAAAELSQRTRIIVVADGALNYIPFQILPSPGSPDKPLVSNYEIINTPSASILGQLQQEAARRHSPTKILAAFGDPVFPTVYAQLKNGTEGETVAQAHPSDNSLWRSALRDIEPDADSLEPEKIQRLFYARKELMNLREVAGKQIFLAMGYDASRERLENADLTQYAIVHFATHGILNPKRPEKSGFLLSTVRSDGRPQNGFVVLSDIYRLHVPVKLVVLSACRTGLGEEVRGEGLIGLTRGFMYAGASSVVASLWKVDDEATSELMKRFYTNMLQYGMEPARALRAAQNSIRQEAHWSSPYYWAAFTFQGNYRDPITVSPAKRDSLRDLVIMGVALLLVLPLMLVSYHRMRIAVGDGVYWRAKK